MNNCVSLTVKKYLLKFTGTVRPDVYSAYTTMNKSCGLSSDELNEVSKRKLEKLLVYSYNSVPYYKKIFDDVGFNPNDFNDADFKGLPVLTKDIFRNNQAELISTEVKKKIMLKTGGSTGEPLRVYKDIDCRAQDIASQYHAMGFSGYKFIEDKFVFFIGGSIGLNKEHNISRKFGDYLFNRITLSAFALNKNTAENYYNIIIKNKCRYMFGYSSVLYNFAEYIFQKNLHFDKGFLKGVFSTSEMLYPEQREFIERILNCSVFDFYGSIEVNCMASQCWNMNYHILSDSVYMETDENDNLIITDLKNYAQPIIRYKNGDRIVMEAEDKKCECGLHYPLLKKILGRTGDVIYRANGEPISNIFFTHLFGRLNSYKSYQVVQSDYGSINFNLVKSASFNVEDEGVLILKLKEYLGEHIKITINYVQKIPLTKSGKLRITISEIDRSKFY